MSSAGEGGAGDAPESLKLVEQMGFYIDIWKKTVDVQQHFNDIQWRIRGLALTVATFTLGAAGLAAKDSTRIGFLSLGATVATVGLILWYAFYFVDRYWYHVFLKAAVDRGTSLEKVIKDHLPDSELGVTIKARSTSAYPGALASRPHRTYLSFRGIVPSRHRPAVSMRARYRFWRQPATMDSTRRLAWFYAVGSVPFIVVAVTLQISAIVAVAHNGTPAFDPQVGKTVTHESPITTSSVPSSTTTSSGTPPTPQG